MSAIAYTYTFHMPIPINPKVHLSSSRFVIKHQFAINQIPKYYSPITSLYTSFKSFISVNKSKHQHCS